MIPIVITVASDLCDVAAVTRLVRRFVTEKMESICPPVYATLSMAANKEFLSRYLYRKHAMFETLRRVALKERSIIIIAYVIYSEETLNT